MVTEYVALLRGIAPSNPNQRNENLRKVTESLGLANVHTVISSGNIVFETDRADAVAIESEMEAAWADQLGFESTTILRSREELETLVESRPFGEREHGPKTYLLTTFAKSGFVYEWEFPFQPDGKDYWVVAGTDREIFTITDTVNSNTPDVMTWVEAELGRDVTSRTWLTVLRILERMART
jgi:uncharacterized protein (DUF1697 family)